MKGHIHYKGETCLTHRRRAQVKGVVGFVGLVVLLAAFLAFATLAEYAKAQERSSEGHVLVLKGQGHQLSWEAADASHGFIKDGKCRFCGQEFKRSGPEETVDEEGRTVVAYTWELPHAPFTEESSEMRVTTCQVQYVRMLANLLGSACEIEVKEQK